MTAVADQLRLGRQLHQAGHWQQAAEIYEQVLRATPDLPQALYSLAVLNLDARHFAAAADQLERCLRGDPTRAAYHAELAAAYRGLGRDDDAIASYRRALDLKPEFAQGHNNLGNIHRDRGALDTAETCYRRAIEADPRLAEAHNNLGAIHSQRGQIEEAISCYRQAIALRGDYPIAHQNLGLALQKQARWQEAADSFSAALRYQPGWALLHYHLGLAYDALEKTGEAQASYERAIAIDPRFAAAHNNLGVIQQDRGELVRARQLYERAIAVDPNYIEAHYNLGTLDEKERNWTACERRYRAALAIDPQHLPAILNLGQALSSQGRFDEALECLDRVLMLEPEHARARYNRSILWLRQGNFVDGWRDYEFRWQVDEFEQRVFAEPEWDGSKLPDATLLVHTEQGFGDALQFVRYLTWVQARVGKLWIKTEPALVPLLSQSGLPGRFVGSLGDEAPAFDARVALMSLPRISGTTLESIPQNVPYLRADAALVEKWSRELASLKGVKIGINWQGRPDYFNDHSRSIPLRAFAALAKCPGARLISLQKHVGLEQLDDLRGDFEVIRLGDEVDQAAGPFMDTAAIMRNLDLVVTCDSALAHLAGALGVPVWLGLSRLPDWRWLEHRGDSPWYPSVRLFRQARDNDWADVFERMRLALLERDLPAKR